MKKRKASTRNLHNVKNVNESLNISSFRSLHKFTDKLPFINTCLTSTFENVWRKIETVFIYGILHVMFTLKLTAVNIITGAKNYYFASSPLNL